LIQLRPALGDREVTEADIVDLVRRLVVPMGRRAQIELYIAGKVHDLFQQATQVACRHAIRPGPGAHLPFPHQFLLPPSARSSAQTVLSGRAQIDWGVAVVSGDPANTSQDVTMRFSVERNVAGHPGNASGIELEGVIQFGYNITTRQVNISSSGQLTGALSLFRDLLQISGFVELLTSVAADRGSVSGQIQSEIGAQAMVRVGEVQFGVQVSAGVTAPGEERTLEREFGVSAAVRLGAHSGHAESPHR
jgi:hypothetical protein